MNEMRRTGFNKIQQGLLEEAFEKLSNGQGFFGGETIGYIDIALGSCLGWLKVVEILTGSKYIDETTTPSLYVWAKRFSSDAAVKDLIPEIEKLLDFAKMHFSGKFGPPK
ncbi:hypothetical protein IFM89_005452 [Coptis chinensis]|uniref:GST C-terminal domain-containing protein n=1 Tax=Coptis chinensis TaxID=261450 RepID=A0A835IX56_9MAGN|nr:hypothetical protein IFM89_005452 [Coptis chinensis]